MSTPVPVEQHLREILDRIRRVDAQPVPLLDALGLVAAEDVASPMSVPPFANSAMDGYAVRSGDLAGAAEATPVALPVLGEIHAGPAREIVVEPGSVVRIMTGAPMPAGADAVVPFEIVREADGRAEFCAPAPVGRHVRVAGDDVRRGDQLVAEGTVIGPREVGLLANVGLPTVSASPKLRVVVMSTGAELIAPGQPLTPGTIHDSNSFMLAAAVQASGHIAHRVHAPSDDPESFLATLDAELAHADAIITTGGVSMGTRDVVKEALSERGDQVIFRQVAMQPGKPQGFGTVGADGVPIFTLPGNPVSAYISFHVFVEPALRAMSGRAPFSRPRISAVLQESVRSAPGKTQFLRGFCDGSVVTPVGGHGSHLVGNLARSNALIVIDPDVTEVAAGETVPVMLLDREF